MIGARRRGRRRRRRRLGRPLLPARMASDLEKHRRDPLLGVLPQHVGVLQLLPRQLPDPLRVGELLLRHLHLFLFISRSRRVGNYSRRPYRQLELRRRRRFLIRREGSARCGSVEETVGRVGQQLELEVVMALVAALVWDNWQRRRRRRRRQQE